MFNSRFKFYNSDNVSDFQGSDKSTYYLKLESSKQYISYFFIKWKYSIITVFDVYLIFDVYEAYPFPKRVSIATNSITKTIYMY